MKKDQGLSLVIFLRIIEFPAFQSGLCFLKFSIFKNFFAFFNLVQFLVVGLFVSLDGLNNVNLNRTIEFNISEAKLPDQAVFFTILRNRGVGSLFLKLLDFWAEILINITQFMCFHISIFNINYKQFLLNFKRFSQNSIIHIHKATRMLLIAFNPIYCSIYDYFIAIQFYIEFKISAYDYIYRIFCQKEPMDEQNMLFNRKADHSRNAKSRNKKSVDKRHAQMEKRLSQAQSSRKKQEKYVCPIFPKFLENIRMGNPSANKGSKFQLICSKRLLEETSVRKK